MPWDVACAHAGTAPSTPRPRSLLEPALLSKYPVLNLAKSLAPRKAVQMSPTLTVTTESSIGAIATIYDYNVFLYAFSQIYTQDMPDLTARFRAADFIDVMNWDNGGSGYQRLKDALARLRSTTITIVEVSPSGPSITVFPLVADIEILTSKENGKGSNQVSLRIPETIATAAERSGGIVNISRDYCKLTRPTDRALYRTALHDMTAGRIRKQKVATWTVGELITRLGSPQRTGPFKRDLIKTVDDWSMPSMIFSLEGLDRGRDTVLRAEFV